MTGSFSQQGTESNHCKCNPGTRSKISTLSGTLCPGPLTSVCIGLFLLPPKQFHDLVSSVAKVQGDCSIAPARISSFLVVNVFSVSPELLKLWSKTH